MSDDKIDYETLVEKSLLSVVKSVLADTAENGLRGNHYFYITFKTQMDGVVLSDRLIQAYPDEMTIVLQYEFYDLIVNDDAFAVRLSFGNVPETITVPFDAIVSFSDPHAQFAVQFHVLPPVKKKKPAKPVGVTAEPAGDNVVSLAAFRKSK